MDWLSTSGPSVLAAIIVVALATYFAWRYVQYSTRKRHEAVRGTGAANKPRAHESGRAPTTPNVTVLGRTGVVRGQNYFVTERDGVRRGRGYFVRGRTVVHQGHDYIVQGRTVVDRGQTAT
jgi:hypothetical protein